jgi:plastocyanin
MRKSLATAVLVIVVAALAALVALPAFAATPVLNGTVGPGFTIVMKKKPTKAGKYKLVVADKSSIHNFHLTGPGFNRKTSVGAVKNETWRIHLRKGTYKYVCDPHKSIMHGSFKVT